MLDWINKENINAKDYASTYKGESVMYEGIATYKDESVFLSKDTLKKCMPNLKGRPVIIEHKLGIKPDNMEKYAVGYVTDCEYNNETGDFDCDFVTWNDEAKELLKNGYTLSTSYIPKEFGNGGTFINTPYDKEIKDLNFTHLAIVKNPRYEKAKVYMNSTEKLNDKWITKFDKEGEPYHVNIDPTDNFKKGGKPDENTRSILKSSGFRWSPRENAWQRQLTGNAEWALRRVIDKMEKSKPENQNDINEEKENYCMDKIEIEQGFLKSLLDRVSKTLEFSNADDEEEILAAEKAAKEAEEKAKAEEEAKKKAEEEAKAKEEAEKAAKEKENSVDWFEKMQEVMNSNDRGEADKIKPSPNAKSALEKGKKIFG